MNLSKFSKEVEAFRPALASQLRENAAIAQAVSDELRTTSYLLHPPLLDEMGLQAGLRWYIEGFQGRTNIEVSLNLPENLERLPPELELMIFRVLQECHTNIHRHSGSPTAAICLCNLLGKITVAVRDQGKGLSGGKLPGVTGPWTAGVSSLYLLAEKQSASPYAKQLWIASEESPIHGTTGDAAGLALTAISLKTDVTYSGASGRMCLFRSARRFRSFSAPPKFAE